MREKTGGLENAMGDIHNEGGAQKNAVETLQGKISCHKYEQELAEGES